MSILKMIIDSQRSKEVDCFAVCQGILPEMTKKGVSL